SYAEGMWHNLRRGLFIIGESALLEWLEGLFFGVFSGSGPGWWASERLSATGGTARFGPGGRREGFFCKLSGGFFHSLPLASIIEKEKRSS
ncbi:MAG: hypothetical protein KDD45_18670, partial [Bdellovibrionales bacterium]|nr:hypothetical protein [Bdellovibrionales bacterium]